jgi:hypothetical protein
MIYLLALTIAKTLCDLVYRRQFDRHGMADTLSSHDRTS